MAQLGFDVFFGTIGFPAIVAALFAAFVVLCWAGVGAMRFIGIFPEASHEDRGFVDYGP